MNFYQKYVEPKQIQREIINGRTNKETFNVISNIEKA